VILQEIRMLEDNPDDFIHDLFHQNVWAGHPLGMPIIGREESVEGLSRDFLVAYQAEKYRAEEIIVTAAGQLEHQELLGLLGEVFARIPRGNGKEGYRFPGYEKRVDIVQRDLEQVLICLGTKALPQNHPRRYESYILNTVLGGGMSSRLFQEVREKQGLAYSVYSYLASHTDAGTLVVSAGTSPEKYRQVIEIVLAELRKLKEEPLPAVELDAAREQLKGNILLSLESSDNRMSKLAKNEIYFGAYQPLDQLMAGFDAVTAESLLQVSRELLDDRSLTLQLMGNVEPQSISHADLVL
jgi:predicted Zn-dependent peptidase